MACEQIILSNNQPKYTRKLAYKLAFTKFVESKKVNTNRETHSTNPTKKEKTEIWDCCSIIFNEARDIHKHVAIAHKQEVNDNTERYLSDGCEDARWDFLRKPKRNENGSADYDIDGEMNLPCSFSECDLYEWLPSLGTDTCTQNIDTGQILLFYKYRDIKNTKHVLCWQKELCRRLALTGKVRIATEGINCTVGGSVHCTEMYVEAVKKHPLFCDMSDVEFKRSAGDASSFPDGLKVGVYDEIVPMGVPPKKLSYKDTGKHISVDEFHDAAKKFHEEGDQKVFIDCRNFYESRIGQFEGALCPNIRKFSYWPEYVDKNQDLFQNKDVYMYCTGGIRCERGSAYLLSKGICNDVYQLEGGIHKYIEKYPDGFFRGKMFVFDDRYHIQANADVLSNCIYCNKPWDQYKPCSSNDCHQLVLICPGCRENQLTACCPTCHGQDQKNKISGKEQCECTQHRDRIPIENKPMEEMKSQGSQP